jgi:CPA1 family monovalent cation:H+ antiporter
MRFELAFLALFAVATAVALLARWVRVPYTVALVVAGLVLGTTHAFEPPHLTKELLYSLFLPGLLFEAAFHLEFKRFWQNKLAIFSLAIPGVAAAIAATAGLLVPVANALHFVEGFGLVHGLLFASIIAATDPIAVVALFKSLGAPKRLAVLVEGESLLNDGTAVVFFTLILAFVEGQAFSASHVVLEFVKVAGMGALIGAAVGFGASKIIQRVDDPMIEITVTTLCAYGSFITAEQFHYSGVIATVVAGMLCGNYGATTGMTPSTRIAVESFWEYVAFALNSCVFLLIGFQVRVPAMLHAWKAILVAWLAVSLARALVIFGASALLARSSERIPWRWGAVLTWGGLRGGLSMVLVLALPLGIAHRELLVNMTFGVVILSILVQGLTMGPFLRWLGIIGIKEERTAYEVKRGSIRTAKAALGALSSIEKEGALQRDLLDELRARYEERIREAEAAIATLHLAAQELREDERHGAERQLLHAEKEALLREFGSGHLGREAFEMLHTDVDARIYRLESGDAHAPAPVSRPSAS